MELSEAMRLGSMMKRQAFNDIRGRVDGPSVPGDILGLRSYETTCAWAAAIDAFPLEVVPGEDKEAYILRGGIAKATAVLRPPLNWAEIVYQERPCPDCGRTVGIVFDTIAHLNDAHQWPREQIANWIAVFEVERDDAKAATAADSQIATV